MSFPILEKCGTWASPVPRRSENGYTGMDGWPCQRVSLYKDPKSGSESVEVFLWVINLWDGEGANLGISEASVTSLLE
jgi:hypothetical protein